MEEKPHILWKRCLDIIQNNVNEQQFGTWFAPIKFKSYSNEKAELVLFIPSQFFYEYLEGNFRQLLHLTIDRVYGKSTKLTYEVEVAGSETMKMESETTPANEKQAVAKREPNKSPSMGDAVGTARDLDSQLNGKQNFNNFIEGNSNKLPRTIGQTIAERPDQQTFNPLFIYGPSGVGKTHLANAIGSKLKELHPQKRVLYLSAHLFQVQYTDSVRNNSFNDFMHFYQSIDALIVDDIQELIGKERTQYAFFHIFNHLVQNGKQIILTSDRPPVCMQGVMDRLITRFKGGLLAELERPEEQLRKHILENKIRHEGLNIPEDVISYISHNISESVRELEGVINSLMLYSVVYNRDVDLELAQRILKHNANTEKKNITLDVIVERTSEFFQVKQEDIYGKSRKAEIVLARQLSMYLAQQYTQLSANKIGIMVGNKNHATVLHSVQAIKTRLKNDKEFEKKVTELKNKLKNNS